MESKLQTKIPPKIKKMLDDFGYDNHVSMSKMTDDDIDELKEHAANMPDPINIATGHRYLIKGLRGISQNIVDVPASLRMKKRSVGRATGGASQAESTTNESGSIWLSR